MGDGYVLLAEAVILQAKKDFIDYYGKDPCKLSELKKEIMNPHFSKFLPPDFERSLVVEAFEKEAKRREKERYER